MIDEATRRLLAQAAAGDAQAAAELWRQHRAALYCAIALRLDRRVAKRVDVSDVLQETFLEATRRLPEYLERGTLPFDLWLRWLAREQTLQCHRRHLAEKRAVSREVGELPADSSHLLVQGLVSTGPSPSRVAAAAEQAERLRRALQELDEGERDLILWRHFEQLSNRDVAQLLHITEAAAGKRYLRAVERLRELLVGTD